MTEESVVIGVIGRPHGVRGAVRATATGATLGTLVPGDAVDAGVGDGPGRRLVIEGRDGPPGRPILRFAGVRTREEAAALTGATIRVAEGRLAPLPDADTFFVRDLVGFEVVVGGRSAGRVAAVHAAPANDVLEVRGDGRRLLVPFTGDAVTELDAAARRIVVRDGLLEE